MNRVLRDGRSIVALPLAFSSPGNVFAVVIVDVEDVSVISSHF